MLPYKSRRRSRPAEEKENLAKAPLRPHKDNNAQSKGKAAGKAGEKPNKSGRGEEETSSERRITPSARYVMGTIPLRTVGSSRQTIVPRRMKSAPNAIGKPSIKRSTVWPTQTTGGLGCTCQPRMKNQKTNPGKRRLTTASREQDPGGPGRPCIIDARQP